MSLLNDPIWWISWILLPPYWVWSFNFRLWRRTVKGSLEREKYARRLRKVLIWAILLWPVNALYEITLSVFKPKDFQGAMTYAIIYGAAILFLWFFNRDWKSEFKPFLDDDETFKKWRKKITKFVRNTFKVHQVAPVKGR